MTTRPECPLVQERLPALMENDLSPGETLLVRAHLEGCPPCSVALDDLQLVMADLAAESVAAALELGDSRFETAQHALMRALDDEKPLRLLPRRLILAAAALLLTSGLTWAVLQPLGTPLSGLSAASSALAQRLDMSAFQWNRIGFPRAGGLPGEDR